MTVTWAQLLAVLLPVVGALSGAIVVLWKRESARNDRCETELKDMKKEIRELVEKRIADRDLILNTYQQAMGKVAGSLDEAIDEIREGRRTAAKLGEDVLDRVAIEIRTAVRAAFHEARAEKG